MYKWDEGPSTIVYGVEDLSEDITQTEYEQEWAFLNLIIDETAKESKMLPARVRNRFYMEREAFVLAYGQFLSSLGTKTSSNGNRLHVFDLMPISQTGVLSKLIPILRKHGWMA